MAINPAACYHSHEQQHMKKVALNQIGSIQSGKKISYTCIFICMKTGYLLQYLLILYSHFIILFGENVIEQAGKAKKKRFTFVNLRFNYVLQLIISYTLFYFFGEQCHGPYAVHNTPFLFCQEESRNICCTIVLIKH